ncbi:MAG: alpha/beta hydrolase family protein [Blastocatellia bacterium]|nr:alpha/beta hydrolase family protein [Blastocatellia bacterium]
MNRRDFMRGATLAAAGLASREPAADRQFQSGYVGKSRIYYEVHGNPKGKPLFLGFPIFASQAQIFTGPQAGLLSGFLERLTDRYRVLVADYPTIGKSGTTPATELTAERVSADLLSVADAAGFRRFAYWGYAWGAAAGLQMASRTKRLSALVIGGWPPLGGDYAGMLQAARTNLPNPSASSMQVLRSKEQYQQWVTFYESVQNWAEAKANAGFKFPKLVFYGADSVTTTGGVTVGYAATIRERRKELEALGWRVNEIPGKGHGVGLEPAAIVPVVREFLDKAI